MVTSMKLVIIGINNPTVLNLYINLGYSNIRALHTTSIKHPLMEYCPHSGISGKHETVLQWFNQVSFCRTVSTLSVIFTDRYLMSLMCFLSPQTLLPTSAALSPLTCP